MPLREEDTASRANNPGKGTKVARSQQADVLPPKEWSGHRGNLEPKSEVREEAQEVPDRIPLKYASSLVILMRVFILLAIVVP